VQFARGSWSTHGPSDPGPCRTAQLVDTEDPRAWALGVRDSWSTARSLRTGPESPGIAGRPHGTSGSSPRRLGQLVDRGSPDPCAGRPGQLFDTRASGTVPVTRDIWWTPQALGNGPEFPRDSWATPQALGAEPESPGAARRPRGPSDPSASVPGQLVDPTGPWARARFPWDSQSTSQALGPGTETPGTACRPRRHSEPGRSRPGHLVAPACPRAWARVARDSGSTAGPWTRTRVGREI